MCISVIDTSVSGLQKCCNEINIGKNMSTKESFGCILTSKMYLKLKLPFQVLLQEKVNNPEKAAKRKLQLREKKKQAKRVKLDSLHGKRPKGRKRKAEDIDIEDKLLMEE